jgi:hypothetical protein
MIINPYLVQPSGPSYDADAQAFFTAAGITDTTQKSAVNQLVLDLKSYSIWTKMTALYPFVGGTASTHSYNLKNTSQYQITFSGGWTHSSTGALPNGTNGYANTGILASSFGSDYMLNFYSRTNSDGLLSDLGTYNETNINATVEVLTRLSGSLYMDIPDVNNRSLLTNSDSRGNFIFFNNSSNGRRAFRNSTSLLNTTYLNASMTNKNLIFSDWGYLASGRFSNRELAFGGFGSGFTATDASNYYTAVQAFQTTLSRNV